MIRCQYNYKFMRSREAELIKSKIAKYYFPAIIIGISFLIFSCSSPAKRTPSNPTIPSGPVLPASLPEAISYDNLSQGKLVFERIGPSSNAYTGVYVIDVNARRSWSINYGGTGPQVSPDGTRIAFSKYVDLQTVYDIHVMNIDGTQSQNISWVSGQDQQPSWTPDSLQLLFYVPGLGLPRIYKQAPVANAQDRIAIQHSFIGLDGPFSVSPNLKMIFIGYLAGEIPQIAPIWTMNTDGSNAIPIGPNAPDGFSYHSPVWSPDGTRIAYLMTKIDATANIYIYKSTELFIMDADGQNVRSSAKYETNADGSYSGQNDFSVCWSPDGSKLAFNVKEGHLSSHIFLINADGTGLTQVTSESGVTDRSLSWSR
jgi:Tol biopolymer transport system component